MKVKRMILFYAVAFFLLSYSVYGFEGKKKVLFIDSYNTDNFWSVDLEKGIRHVLKKYENIELKIFRMDSKRVKQKKEITAVALKAKELIEAWKPDVVIASDDNASKYIIAPYYLNSALPVVFCGINYDASQYGFPADNITGMLEVVLLDESFALMRKYAKGDKIGFIASNNYSDRKAYRYLVEKEKRRYAEAVFVDTFAEFKDTFLWMQKKVDMMYLLDIYSVADFDLAEMISFALENTTVPTTASLYDAIRYCLLGTTKSAFEQGEWSAATAVDILNGKSPADIPVAKNKQGKLYLNMDMAKVLGIRFPVELIDSAYLINSQTP